MSNRPAQVLVSRRRRPAAALALLLLAWSAIPLAYLLFRVQRDGGVLSGTEGMLAGADQQLYMTWIRQSGEHLLIANPYRMGASEHVFFHPMFALSGGLWKLGLDLRLVLLLWKPVACVLLAAGTWSYVRRLLPDRRRALVAAVLGLFYFSPALPLLQWTDSGVSQVDLLFFQFVSGDAMPALQLHGYVHAAIVVGLMALALLAVERVLDPARRASGRSQWWYLGWTAAAGLVVGWVHPWHGATLIGIVVGLAAWGRFRARYRILAVPVLVTAMPMVYELVLTRADWDWRLNADQLSSPHAPLWILGAAFLPLLIPALAGARWRADDDQERMLLLWPAVALVAYLAAAQFPFHAFQGPSIPLAVLAVRGFDRVAWRVPHARVVALVLVAVVTLPGAAYVLRTLRTNVNSQVTPYTLTAGEHAALDHLERAPRRGGVLARYYIGSTVPPFTGRRTWVGQYFWTPDSDDRIAAADDLFLGRMPRDRARDLVRAVRPAYLLSDCHATADLPRLLGPLVVSERRFGCATVYEVRS